MPYSTNRDNRTNGKVGDYLKESLTDDASVSIVSAYFTIYAYYQLKENLDKIKELRFLFGEPTFIKSIDNNKNPREFKIEDNQFTLDKRLNQKKIARECAEWMFCYNEGFDIVIGNPPYVQLQKFKGQAIQKTYKEQNYQSYDSMGDIYGLFYEKGIDILKEKGHLCFITSNKWMRAGYGEKLRKYFTEYNPKILIDLGPGVFKSATVDTNILLIEKSRNENNLKALTYYSDLISIRDAMNSDSLCLNKLTQDAWFIGNPAEISLKEKIERIGKPLKDWDVNINYGIKTGLNEAFIIDTATKDRLWAEDPKSAEIIKPVLRGRDIKRYGYDWAGLWIIFIPWHFPLHNDSNIQGSSEEAEKQFQIQYPAIYHHLFQFKPALSNRNKAETGIRYEWYALQRCAASYYDEFEKEKIIFKEMVVDNTFSFDTDSCFCVDTCRIITGNQLKFLLAILNSKLFFYCVKKFYGGGTLGNSGIRMKHTFFNDFCIAENDKLKIDIESLVDEILSQKSENQNSDTSLLINQIDQLVYQLYELTDEEIALIEKA